MYFMFYILFFWNIKQNKTLWREIVSDEQPDLKMHMTGYTVKWIQLIKKENIYIENIY